MKYQKLFEPYILPNGVVLRNRMECPPSGMHFLQAAEPYPTESVIANYTNRAKNGAGIVVVHGCRANGWENNPGHGKGWDASNGHNQHMIAQLVEGIHAYGSKALHRGGDISEFLDRRYDVSTGVATAWVVGDGSQPRYDCVECPREEMLRAADEFVQFCRLLKNACGYDGVWIHGSYRHAFLGRCLSPLTNLRTDEFGGSIENRARFPRLVFEKIKEACGKDFIIEFSVSGHDPEGGATMDDMIQTVQQFEGVLDIVQVRAPWIDESHPVQFFEETPWLYMAEAFKKQLKGIAVLAVGGYFFPDTVQKVLENGQADLIGMARAFISNPEYGKLLLQDRAEDIVPCIRCNKCHRSSDAAAWTSVCSVNPANGIEHRIAAMLQPVEGRKKVAVIGGGPAGMKAAITASDRGHAVTLFERAEKLGGQMCATQNVSFKWPYQRLRQWLIAQVEKRPITLKLSTEPAPEDLTAQGFDVILAAVGAVPRIPALPGAEGENVLTAIEAFTHPEKAGEKVVIVGGGEVGVEAGIYFARLGHPVTVLSRRGRLADDSTPVHYWKMFRDAWEGCEGFTGITGAAATAIGPDSVTYRDAEGAEQTIPADTVILAVGMDADSANALRYAGAAGRFELIGDCEKPANIQKLMRRAYIAASQF